MRGGHRQALARGLLLYGSSSSHKALGQLNFLLEHVLKAGISRSSSSSSGGGGGARSWQVAADVAKLRQLNLGGEHRRVIELVQTGRVTLSDATLGEYVTALVKTDSMAPAKLWAHLRADVQRATQAESSGVASPQLYPGPLPTTAAAPQLPYQVPAFQPPPPYQAPPFAAMPFAPYYGAAQPPAMVEAMKAGKTAGNGSVGSQKNPVFISHVEPSFLSHVFRLLRALGLAFILVSAMGAMLEDRSVPRQLLSSPDLKPQVDTSTRLDDVKGVDEAKAELEEIVQYLREPHKFTTLGGKLPKGVLLVGPPGTGKTMLARAIAGEAGVPFFYSSGSEFEEMFVGVGARRVRDLFAAAKKHAPCIVFIDEIDAIGGSRNPKDQVYMKMTLNQMLVELDGFKPSEGVIVIAATNFPELLDKALVRPGRFDRHVVVPNPDVRGRQQILEQHFGEIPRDPAVDLGAIARGTPGFSGADLANLVNLAALKAARDGRVAVDMKALEFAKDRIMMGAERKSAVISDSNRRLTAYHEGGHALVALHTSGAHPVHKATIVPRGQALGMVTQLPDADAEISVSRRQLLAKLDVAMGGRVAEELIFGVLDVTTGASSDLASATKLARDMVMKYGMSAKLGTIAVDARDYGGLSPEMKRQVESEVKELLKLAYERARKILTENRDELEAVAAELLERETLTGEQIKDVIRRVGDRRQGNVSGNSQ